MLPVLLALCIHPLWAQQRRPLEPADLVSSKSIEAVELSPDGQQVIFAVKEPDFTGNRFKKSLWITRTSGKEAPARLTTNDGDDSAKWSPDGNRIAFLSARDGSPQVWVSGKTGDQPEKLTNIPGGVLSYQWAPNGQQIALTARSADKGPFEAQRNKDAGVVINKWDFVVYKLLNSSTFLQLDQRHELWMADAGSRRWEPLITDRHVTQFAWSPDSRHIAVIFQSLPGLATQRTDALIYSVATRQQKVILQGTGGRDFDDTSGYSNPIWSPDGASLALFFKQSAGRWQAQSQLGLYRLSESRFAIVPGVDRLVLYVPQLTWIHADHMFLENAVRGSTRLFSLALSNGMLEPAGEHHGSESRHSFSRDGKVTAFVRESTQTPPELYAANAPFTASTRITSLNARYAEIAIPSAERLQWKSTDGAEVEGWLLKPSGMESGRKYPLVVIVHGGPGVAVPDAFEMYFEWPYPYRLFASRGYVVLLPNYRGTGSYSHAFSKPRDLADEPVEDIVSGIRSLIGKGYVDEKRIGIAGHSHGGWLGPQVLTTHPAMFRAASFAEGAGNTISGYGQMPGWLNLNIHDYYYGGPPYVASPVKYIAESPIFHVAGLTTPTLFEFGDQSLAAQGLEYHSAFWRCGVPSELIIYPRTGHNMSRPAQEVEAIERNLDWFDYWMSGKKDGSAAKQEQYQRWERLAGEMVAMRAKHSCIPEAKTNE